jgi:RHS repeat-associated protein
VSGQDKRNSSKRLNVSAKNADEDAKLQNNNARWYDPAIGRFLSADPSGFDAGDPNLYRYVGNSPPNGTDPTGLRTYKPTDYLPALNQSPFVYATGVSATDFSTFNSVANRRLPTVDEAIKQSLATPSFVSTTKYSELVQPRHVVNVQKIGGEAYGDYFREGADVVARDFENGGLIDTMRWGIIKGTGYVAGALTDAILPPSDPSYLMTYSDGTRQYNLSGGPTTGALTAQVSVFAPTVVAGASRPAGQLLRTPEAQGIIAPRAITPNAIAVERLSLENLSAKQLSRLREARVQFKLEGKFGNTNVLTERMLLNSKGEKVLDPLTGTGRRIDNVVLDNDRAARFSVEVTSRRQAEIQAKRYQINKELRIRAAGGTFVRDPYTRQLIDISGIPTRVVGVEPL